MTFKADTRCKCEVHEAVNFGERAEGLKTDILLLHYTGMESADAALNWLCVEESGVSCHYVVYEDGRVFQLVPESKRAWHAGKSCWQNEVDTNSRSIGIEIANPGHSGGYPDFPDEQICSVIELCKDIIKRNPDITAGNVLAHSDVAPGRKHDPGEKFPWVLLHNNGIGLWTTRSEKPRGGFLQMGDEGEPVAALQAMLSLYGYGIEISGVYNQNTHDCVFAFQQHFRQELVDGVADGGTIAVLNELIRLRD